MKDRYLFRVWCKNKNEWEKNRIALLPNGNLIDLDNQVMLRHETHIVEFCIGLKDKNGELIFEGDKVRYETGQPDRPHIEEEVYWGDGAFYPVCTMPSSEFEIIGNIHNKES